MEEWKTVEIKEICTGIFEGPHATPKESSVGGYYLGIPAIGSDGHINFENAKRISEEDLPAWTKRVVPQEDDIVFTNEATLNLYAIIPAGFHGCLGRRLGLIRPNKDLVNVRYLFYYFFSPEWRNTIEKNKVYGATVERILMTKFPHFPVRLPSREEQDRIADILSCIDKKIELNTRINHNLEEQAQALYRSWFVDFEPFKDGRFVESELGFIPEGWRVGSIYDICEIYYGAPFNSTLFNTEKKGLPLIRIRDLAKQEAGVFTEERHIKGQLTHKGDVLVGMDGEFSIYIWGGVDSWINQRISRFTPKPGISHYFLTETLRPQLKAVESSEVATTVIHIGKNDYDKFLAIIPPQRVMDSFYHVSEPLFLQYVENLSSNHSLSESRDILLPRLMSGQLTC